LDCKLCSLFVIAILLVTGLFSVQEAFAGPPPQADISITKTASVIEIAPGDTFDYTMTVKNNGPDNSGLIFADDFLPSEVTFLSVDNPGCFTSGSEESTDVLCDLENIAPGEEVKITITVQVNADVPVGTVLSNEAQAVPGFGNDVVDPDDGNNTIVRNGPTVIEEVVAGTDISITKIPRVSEIEPGGPFSYDLTITNAGPSDVGSVVVTDSVLNNMEIRIVAADSGTCDLPDGGKSFTCTIGPLLAGTSQNIVVGVSVDADAPDMTTLVNSADVSPGPNDPDLGNNSVVVEGPTVKVPLPSADTSITKTPDVTEVAPGDTFSYDIVVTNAGPSDVDMVTVTDTLRDFMTVDSVTPDSGICNINADKKGFMCAIGPLPEGTSQNIVAVVSVDPTAPDMTTLVNTIDVTLGPNDDDPDNNLKIIEKPIVKVIPVPKTNLVITKLSDVSQVIPDEIFSYFLIVENEGPAFAENVVVDDTVLTTTLVEIIGISPGAPTCTFTPLTAKCKLGDMAPLDSEVIDVTARVILDAKPGSILVNKGDVKSDTPEKNPTDNTSTAVEPQVFILGKKIWIGGVGNWNVDANWTPPGVPVGSDDIIIDADPGTNSVVTLNVDYTQTTGSIRIDDGDELIVGTDVTLTEESGDTIIINSGATLTNTGTIKISNDHGTGISNSGTIENKLNIEISNTGDSIGISNSGEIINIMSGDILLSNSLSIGDPSNNIGIENTNVIKNSGDVRIQTQDRAIGIDNSGTIDNDGHILVANRGISSIFFSFDPSGIVNVGKIEGSGTMRIENFGFDNGIENFGSIEISNLLEIENKGSQITSNGILNRGTITVSDFGRIKISNLSGVGINNFNDGKLVVEEKGKIEIFGSDKRIDTQIGIKNSIVGSSFLNLGTVTISDVATNVLPFGDIGIDNEEGILTNKGSMIISVKELGAIGLLHSSTHAPFTNDGTIEIINLEGEKTVGILATEKFINNNKIIIHETEGVGITSRNLINNGDITITKEIGEGIGAGTITNLGTITISNSVGDGILIKGVFKNMGTVNIVNTGGTGIINEGTYDYTNTPTLTVSNTGGIGIHNKNTFDIPSEKKLIIKNSQGIGLVNDDEIINSGSIEITEDMGGFGILNNEDITNSGTITISNGGNSVGISNDDTITNSGLIIVETSGGTGIFNKDNIENSGTITVSNIGKSEGINNESSTINNSGKIQINCKGTIMPIGSITGTNEILLTCRPSFDDFGLNGNADGIILIPGGQTFEIKKVIPSGGLGIHALPTGGPAPATISICKNSAKVTYDAGEANSIICSSVTIKVIQGTIDIEFVTSGAPITTSLDEGEELTFDPRTLEITASPENLEDVIVEIGGEQITISPGQTVHVDIPGAPIGGTFIPIEQTSLILAGTQMTASWLVPVIVSAVGIGLVLVRRKI